MGVVTMANCFDYVFMSRHIYRFQRLWLKKQQFLILVDRDYSQ